MVRLLDFKLLQRSKRLVALTAIHILCVLFTVIKKDSLFLYDCTKHNISDF